MTNNLEKSASGWTVGEIHARLGISTAIYQRLRLSAQHIAKIRQAGISRIELLLKPDSFDYRNLFQAKEVLEECQKQGVKIVSVHAFLGLPYRFKNEAERKLVITKSLSMLRFAEESSVPNYVAHFGCGEHTKVIVPELLNRTDGYSIKLTTENMGALPPYVTIVEEIGSDRFGLTVDIGHPKDKDGANPLVMKEKARQTLAQCGNRISHLHLHETFNLAQKRDHRPPLHKDGIIQWGEVFAALKDVDYKGELLFEDGRGENPEEWVRMTGEFPQEFVRRYGNNESL